MARPAAPHPYKPPLPRTGTFTAPLSALARLLGPATRILALPHVSNILGEVLDLRAVVGLVRAVAPRCRVVADGVAYAPHLPMDVQAWGVDFYFFSIYKVHGPHMAALYGSEAAFAELRAAGGEGPNHYFVSSDAIVYKVPPGPPPPPPP
jgi:selenocysteine lyase/cysteine desulfurase